MRKISEGYKAKEVENEWVSDFMGQRFDEPEFWQDVQRIASERGDTKSFASFARSSFEWLTNLGRKLRRVLTRFADRNYVDRIDEIRQGLASVMNDYIEQMPEGGYADNPNGQDNSTPSIQAMYQLHKNLRADKENNTADDFIANLDRDCAGDYIKLLVRPDAKSYVVSIPARGHQKVFQTKPL